MMARLVILIVAAGCPGFLVAHEGAELSPKPVVRVQVFPDAVDLAGAHDAQSVVVQVTHDDGTTSDVTSTARLSLANSALARVADGWIHPVADGETELVVTVGAHEQRVPVTITGAAATPPVSFKLDVMPVFMKAGCNSGSCHGAARGKDGFHLSLFGYDPDGDYHRITRQFPGRRVNLALPEESLLVEKALGHVPHTGGERFRDDSHMLPPLVEWIGAGAPRDPDDVARPVALELAPRGMVLEGTGATQRLLVRAHYSDGSDRDVTPLALFLSSDDSVARVDDAGLITAGQRGEAFVMARFDTFTVGTQVIVIPENLDYLFPDFPQNNYIDGHVQAKLRKLRYLPSEIAGDEEFLRRVHIDIIGQLPTPEDVARFRADRGPDRRGRVVDALLSRKEFVEIWVMKFAELLQIRSTREVSYKSTLLYFNWLQEKIAANVPMNEIVRELLSATGGTFKNPATNYYQIERDTLKVAENVAQVFLGMRIQCAQCHNHPFDRWTQNDYYGFAAFFSQIGRKAGQDPRETIVFDLRRGEVKHPVTGRDMAPKFLGGPAPDLRRQSRRAALASWVTADDNPFFARNLANIVWAHFFGRGIVEPVDDVRVSNPPSNPELLDALAERFKASRYDFRKLIRDICTSTTYQLSTRPNDTNRLDRSNFSKQSIRRIRSEVLLDCISQVTETRNKFQGLPLGARAVQIADGRTTSYFLTTFGRATRDTVCSCEVKMEPNLSQALHLLNGETVERKIREGKLIERLLADGREPWEIIEELYLRCFSRAPTETERQALEVHLAAASDTKEMLEDAFWAILNSKEFIFNH